MRILFYFVILFSLTNSIFTKEHKNTTKKAKSKQTDSSFIPISSIEGLESILTNLEGHYILTKNLDFNSYISYETGKVNSSYIVGCKNPCGWTPIGDKSNHFKGVFNGNGFKISNLHINRPGDDHIGLFAHSDGIIKNLILLDVTVTGKNYVGGLVGMVQGGTIDNCHSQGVVRGSSSVGGLIGYLGYYFNNVIVINSSSIGTVSGFNQIGGLVGWQHFSTIINSYANSTVVGKDQDSYIGGLVGGNFFSTITNSYSKGSASGNWNVGGLVGKSFLGSVKNSYSLSNSIGSNNIGGLIGNTIFTSISSTYAAGKVSGKISTGGLIGSYYGFSSEKSFWDTLGTGQRLAVGDSSAVNGFVGLTNTYMKVQCSSNNRGICNLDKGFKYIFNSYPKVYKKDSTVIVAGQ